MSLLHLRLQNEGFHSSGPDAAREAVLQARGAAMLPYPQMLRVHAPKLNSPHSI
jgi:hypothetical protein